jgi:hypothetical protein
MAKKTVTFKDIPRKGTFVRGCTLYHKTSNSTAQEISARSFNPSGNRKRFDEDDVVEYLTQLKFVGSAGGSFLYR